MLVLSRKEGESLVIGDNITLVISKVVGNRVTIGIEAPKDVKVMRSELTIELKPAISPIGGNQVVTSPVVGSPIVGGRSTERKPVERKSRVAAISMKDFTTTVRQLQRNVG